MAEKRMPPPDETHRVVPLRPPAPEPEKMSALAAMLAEHDRLHSLCAVLEDIADDLPTPPAPPLCRALISAIAQSHGPGAMACTHMLGQSLQGPYGGLRQRIAAMQAEQEGLGQEIILALEHLARTIAVDAPDMLGYMLRAWFEGCKRLILIEELALLACNRTILAPAYLSALEARLSA